MLLVAKLLFILISLINAIGTFCVVLTKSTVLLSTHSWSSVYNLIPDPLVPCTVLLIALWHPYLSRRLIATCSSLSSLNCQEYIRIVDGAIGKSHMWIGSNAGVGFEWHQKPVATFKSCESASSTTLHTSTMCHLHTVC